MFKNEIDNTTGQPYSSNRFLLLDKIERIASASLKKEVKKVKQLGEEVLLEVEAADLASVLKVIKESPELEINSFRSLVPYNIFMEEYLLLSLFSVNDKIPLLIKVSLAGNGIAGSLKSSGFERSIEDSMKNSPESDRETICSPETTRQMILKKNYIDIINVVRQFYRPAEFYLDFNKEVAARYDLAIPSHTPEGLDAFDIYIKCSGDSIEEAGFDMTSSKVLDNSFYKNLGIQGLLAEISRFDWNAGIFPELCFCLAFETALQLKVPRRAILIRLLLSELFRISSHTYFISTICNILGADIAYNLSLLAREKVLRIIERITGSRIHPNYVRIGGVRKNISEDIIKEAIKELPIFYREIKKINNIVMNNSVMLNALKESGIMDRNLAIEYGVTGPNLRAAGIRYDLRKESSYLNYQDLTFNIPLGRIGDCLDRVIIRFEEIYQSLRITSQIIKKMAHGPVIKRINLENLDFKFKALTSTVECPHGIFKIFMEVERNKIASLAVSGPSAGSLAMGSHILKDNKVENIDLVLATLDISCGEIIRAKNY